MTCIDAWTAERSLSELRPPVKTKIVDEGTVVFHDETAYGLKRMCIVSMGKYPDLETWLGLLEPTARPLAYRYVEKITLDVVFIGYLWIYYKDGR